MLEPAMKRRGAEARHDHKEQEPSAECWNRHWASRIGVLHCNTIWMGLVEVVAATFLFRGSPRNVTTRRFWPKGHQRYANLAEGVGRQDKVRES